MGLQYKICYKKGTENKATDALSRIHPQDELEVLAIYVAQPTWLESITLSYDKFSETAKLLTSLVVESPMGDYTLKEGIIRYKGRVLIPHDEDMQNQILQALHTSAAAGHSGFHVTYKRVKNMFFWQNLKKMIKRFVAHCQVCQQAKSGRVRYLASTLICSTICLVGGYYGFCGRAASVKQL